MSLAAKNREKETLGLTYGRFGAVARRRVGTLTAELKGERRRRKEQPSCRAKPRRRGHRQYADSLPADKYNASLGPTVFDPR